MALPSRRDQSRQRTENRSLKRRALKPAQKQAASITYIGGQFVKCIIPIILHASNSKQDRSEGCCLLKRLFPIATNRFVARRAYSDWMSEKPAIPGVSWTALLIAAIAYALAFVFIDAVIKAAVACALFAGYGYKAGQAFDAFHAMPSVAVSARLLSLLSAALAAGYAAARTAQAQHILVGTLATINPVLISLYVLTYVPLAQDTGALSPWLSPLFSLLTFVGGPMLGAAGGYIAERRESHVARVLLEETTAPEVAAPQSRISQIV